MSDELHKYPGNLKHHRVDKEEQRKLLADMMADDANDGLYDALAKRKPLLSNDALVELTYVKEDGRRPSEQVRDIYEAARSKDAELIQQLVDEVAAWMQRNLDERFRGEQWQQSKRILDAAAAEAGFKPSKP